MKETNQRLSLLHQFLRVWPSQNMGNSRISDHISKGSSIVSRTSVRLVKNSLVAVPREVCEEEPSRGSLRMLTPSSLFRSSTDDPCERPQSDASGCQYRTDWSSHRSRSTFDKPLRKLEVRVSSRTSSGYRSSRSASTSNHDEVKR